MSGKVWISSVLSSSSIGVKQGIRTKYSGYDWTPADFTIPPVPEDVYQNMIRATQGHALQRTEFPEAAAIWDEKSFKKIDDIFTCGGFYVVKGRLSEVLSRFDLGKGGLVPFSLYQADLKLPYPGEYFLLNFGSRKNTILPEQSQNVVKFAVDRQNGEQIWKVNGWHEDGDVVLSSSSLDGPDLWFEELVDNKLFFSNRLAQAITELGMKDIFQLKVCRVQEDG